MPLILALAALSALGEFASMVYLPALPAIAAGLNVNLAGAQATISGALLLFAALQLLYGPLSDRFGRRAVLLPGLLVYIAGGVLCAMATSLEVLMAGRLLQSAGACSGLVVARAIAVDLFEGPTLTRRMAAINIAISAAPAVAPLLGGLLTDAAGWRAPFWVAALFGLALLPLYIVAVPEPHRSARNPLSLGTTVSVYARLARNANFLRYAGASALVLGALFAALVGVAPVMIDGLGVPPRAFGFFPLIAILGFIVGSILTARLADRPGMLLRGGLCLSFFAALFLFTLPATGMLSVGGVLGGMILFSVGLGIVIPVGTAEALRGEADQAGSASGFIGFLQILGTAFGAALVPVIGLPVEQAFPVAMLLLTGSALVVTWRTKLQPRAA